MGPLRPSVFSLMHEELEGWSGVKLRDIAAYGIRVRVLQNITSWQAAS